MPILIFSLMFNIFNDSIFFRVIWKFLKNLWNASYDLTSICLLPWYLNNLSFSPFWKFVWYSHDFALLLRPLMLPSPLPTETLLSFFFSIYLFIYWLHLVLIAAWRLFLVAATRGYPSCASRASHFGGFSCCRAQALWHELSSYGTWA